jgi:hypothetical protein
MGNRSLSLLAVGAVMLVFAFGVSPAHDSNAQVVNGCTAVFDFTGTAKNFTVPSGITEVELNVFGAAGGDATGSAANVSEGGFGAGVQNAVLPVAPGDVLTVIVGGEGGPAESLLGTNPGGTGGFGYNGTATGGQSGGTGGTAQDYHGGGGGGGASAVLLNGTLVVAAGGGGGGSHGGAGGDGGTVGGDGKKGSSGTGDPAAFGLGASQTAGGAGGVGSFGGLNGQAGVAGRGGDGGEAVGTHGGPSSPGGAAGGGGGGGTFGGGGAGGSAASNPGGGAGGGGGSSKTTIGTIQPGVRDGDGQIDVGLKCRVPGRAADREVGQRPDAEDRRPDHLHAEGDQQRSREPRHRHRRDRQPARRGEVRVGQLQRCEPAPVDVGGRVARGRRVEDVQDHGGGGGTRDGYPEHGVGHRP